MEKGIVENSEMLRIIVYKINQINNLLAGDRAVESARVKYYQRFSVKNLKRIAKEFNKEDVKFSKTNVLSISFNTSTIDIYPISTNLLKGNKK